MVSTLVLCLISFNLVAVAAGKQSISKDFRQSLTALFKMSPSVYEEKVLIRNKNLPKDSPLSMDEKVAIYGYTAGLYEAVNSSLRKGAQEAEKYQAYNSVLIRALGKLPKYEGLTLRTTVLPPEVAKLYIEGAIVSDRAFTSTTTAEPRPSRDYMNIRSKTGRSISMYAAIPTESEVLFLPDTKFKVLKVTEKGKDLVIYDLEEVETK